MNSYLSLIFNLLKIFFRELNHSISKLYFDIDIEKNSNPGIKYEMLVELLIDLVRVDAKSTFFIDTSKVDVLILDSSSNLKFSNHVVFQNIVFENNKSCLSYIKYLSLKQSSSKLTVFDSKNKGTD